VVPIGTGRALSTKKRGNLAQIFKSFARFGPPGGGIVLIANARAR
jgi:hypothetical protein